MSERVWCDSVCPRGGVCVCECVCAHVCESVCPRGCVRVCVYVSVKRDVPLYLEACTDKTNWHTRADLNPH